MATSLLKIHLFENVSNIGDVITFVNDPLNMDSEVYVVDAKFVISIFHLQFAWTHATLRTSSSSTKTKSGLFLDELVYWLSGSSNMQESARQFKISLDTNSVVVLFASSTPTPPHTVNDLVGLIKGNEASLDTVTPERFALPANKDRMASIVKVFKLAAPELSVSGLEKACLTRIATKDVF